MKYPLHSLLDVTTTPIREVQNSLIPRFRPLQSNAQLRTSTMTLFLGFKTLGYSKNRVLTTPISSPLLNLNSLCEINFLRKEKMYTKLKYSRCPQYDIISGGFAAIFAGFIGFLISEKFGIELVDSGDFYIALMYGIFAVFTLRPLLRIYSMSNVFYTPVSLKYFTTFWLELAIILLNFFKYKILKL